MAIIRITRVNYDKLYAAYYKIIEAVNKFEKLGPAGEAAFPEQAMSASITVKSQAVSVATTMKSQATHQSILVLIPKLLTQMKEMGLHREIQCGTFQVQKMVKANEEKQRQIASATQGTDQKALQLQMMITSLQESLGTFETKVKTLEREKTTLEVQWTSKAKEWTERQKTCDIKLSSLEEKIVAFEISNKKIGEIDALADSLNAKLDAMPSQMTVTGNGEPVPRGLEPAPEIAELQAKHEQMSAEAQSWRAKHDDQMRQMQDLMLKYQEVTRAHESEAARAKELEIGHATLQQQVQILQQQNTAQVESIQSLTLRQEQAPVADPAQIARQMELNEALLQARGEVQQWQAQHQQAVEELQLKQAELVQITTLNTKVTDLESLVASKQQEVDVLSQQLREAQAGKTELTEATPEKAAMQQPISPVPVEAVSPAATVEQVPVTQTVSPIVSPTRVSTSGIIASKAQAYPLAVETVSPQVATAPGGITTLAGSFGVPTVAASSVRYGSSMGTSVGASTRYQYSTATAPAAYMPVTRPATAVLGSAEIPNVNYRTVVPSNVFKIPPA